MNIASHRAHARVRKQLFQRQSRAGKPIAKSKNLSNYLWLPPLFTFDASNWFKTIDCWCGCCCCWCWLLWYWAMTCVWDAVWWGDTVADWLTTLRRYMTGIVLWVWFFAMHSLDCLRLRFCLSKRILPVWTSKYCPFCLSICNFVTVCRRLRQWQNIWMRCVCQSNSVGSLDQWR